MNYLLIVIIIGALILIHELGHFISAKAAGIPVEIFSIGFGPKILKWKRAETEYRLSIIPLGGYILPAVKDENEFYKIPAFRRIFFSLGGPLANIFMPVLILLILNIFNSGSFTAGIFIKPIAQVLNYLINIIKSIPTMFSRPDQLSGIVGIISTGSRLIAFKMQNAVHILILLSLNLAVFNMLPIPALDGGKILLYLLEKIHPKFLKIQIPAAIAGWIIIIGLMIYATINDVVKLYA